LNQQFMHHQSNVHEFMWVWSNFSNCASLSAVENLSIGLLSFSTKSEPNQLACHKKQIRWTQQKISSPEPPWFHRQSKKPFKATILHPFRRLAQCAGQERKSSAHSNNWHFQAIAKFIRPDFLARTSKPYKGNLRAGH